MLSGGLGFDDATAGQASRQASTSSISASRAHAFAMLHMLPREAGFLRFAFDMFFHVRDMSPHHTPDICHRRRYDVYRHVITPSAIFPRC